MNRTINCYYNIRVKGHFATEWNEPFERATQYPQQDYGSQYTVVLYNGILTYEGQMDFQVQTLIGSVDRADPPDGSWMQRMYAPIWAFNGEKSDWSDTQTLTMPASTPSPTTPSPTDPEPTEITPTEPTPEEPQQPEETEEPTEPAEALFSTTEVILIVAVAASIVISIINFLILRKRNNQN
jgi:hypothetical protein